MSESSRGGDPAAADPAAPHADAQPVEAPHADAESDPRDPSRAANQAREEPVLSTPAHDKTPSAATGQPDTAADGPAGAGASQAGSSHAGGRPVVEPVRDQAGVPERAVTDVEPAPGTSESLRPVEGIHTPDAGPGGTDFDTDQPGVPGRTTGSR